jgi:hypothetical protein
MQSQNVSPQIDGTPAAMVQSTPQPNGITPSQTARIEVVGVGGGAAMPSTA